jgi:TonB family protein
MVNKTDNKKSRFTGVTVTVLLHLLVFALCFRMIFINSTMALPLSVIEVLMEPEPEPVKPKEVQFKIKPVITGKKVEDTPSEPTKPAEIDDHGDVEAPVEKPIPVKINERALFRSQDIGEAEGTASGNNPDSRALFTGDSDPNAGASDEAPMFDLNDRSIMGRLEQPTNTSNKDGRVVVEITVDQKGQVIEARARTRGTTIQDVVLWKAAEDAARKTKFNTDFKSPPLQKGTITYVFRLK